MSDLEAQVSGSAGDGIREISPVQFFGPEDKVHDVDFRPNAFRPDAKDELTEDSQGTPWHPSMGAIQIEADGVLVIADPDDTEKTPESPFPMP